MSAKTPTRIKPGSSPLTPGEIVAVRRLIRRGALEPHYSPAETAELLGLHKRTVLDLFSDGEFPDAFKPFPNKVLIPLGDINAWKSRRRGFSKNEDARREEHAPALP